MSKVLIVLLGCVAMGCMTHRTLELDAQHPAVSLTPLGVRFGDEPVKPEEVAEILADYDIPHDRVIHVLLDPEVKDLRPAHHLRAVLGRAGYTRCIFVTHRHAESENLGKPKKKATAPSSAAARPAAPRTIRYKRANE